MFQSFAICADERGFRPPDPGHPWRAGGTAKLARPPSTSRATHHIAPPLPRHIPNKSEHTGKKAETPAKASAYRVAATTAPQTSFQYQLLGDCIEGPSDFFQHGRKFQRQHRLLGIEHYINAGRALQQGAAQAHRLAEPPLDPVPLNCAAEDASHSKTN